MPARHEAAAESWLRGWEMAVRHIQGLGMGAPAPELAAGHLRRRGVYPDWVMPS